MARLGRKGRVFKWAGLMVSLFVLVAWAASFPVWCAYIVNTSRSSLDLTLSQGCLASNYDRDSLVMWEGGKPWIMGLNRRPWSPCWWARCSRPYYGWHVTVPLWMPFLVFAIPTIWLWWIDRRRIPPGHCRKCGYNLTGNMSGVCPECGEQIVAASIPKG